MTLESINDLRMVTISGECFDLTFKRIATSHANDGLAYLFHVRDATKSERGERLISIYDTENVLKANGNGADAAINFIRKSFDSGVLSFNHTFDPARYAEI